MIPMSQIKAASACGSSDLLRVAAGSCAGRSATSSMQTSAGPVCPLRSGERGAEPGLLLGKDCGQERMGHSSSLVPPYLVDMGPVVPSAVLEGDLGTLQAVNADGVT